MREFGLIENNIFGYISSEIKILDINGCEMFDIILQPKNEPLKVDCILEEEDNTCFKQENMIQLTTL